MHSDVFSGRWFNVSGFNWCSFDCIVLNLESVELRKWFTDIQCTTVTCETVFMTCELCYIFISNAKCFMLSRPLILIARSSIVMYHNTCHLNPIGMTKLGKPSICTKTISTSENFTVLQNQTEKNWDSKNSWQFSQLSPRAFHVNFNITINVLASQR